MKLRNFRSTYGYFGGYSAVICGERVIKAMAGKGKARDMIFTFLSLLFFDVAMASVLSWYK